MYAGEQTRHEDRRKSGVVKYDVVLVANGEKTTTGGNGEENLRWNGDARIDPTRERSSVLQEIEIGESAELQHPEEDGEIGHHRANEGSAPS